MNNLEQLSQIMGEETAHEILKTLENYDKYVAKMKKKLNVLLEPYNHEVKCGILFTEIDHSGDK